MKKQRLLALAVAIGMIAPTTQACFLELRAGGLSVSDPISLPVLVAAHEAETAGRLASLGLTDERALRHAVFLLSSVPRRLDGQKPTVAFDAFAVLQVQSGYWTRYTVEDGRVATEPHRGGPEDGDAVIAIADSAYLAILRGDLDVDAAQANSLLLARDDADGAARAAFAGFLAQFGENGQAR